MGRQGFSQVVVVVLEESLEDELVDSRLGLRREDFRTFMFLGKLRLFFCENNLNFR